MGISFSGLATGLDTTKLVEQLMEQERRPLTQLKNDKTYFNSRLAALGQFEGRMVNLRTRIETLDSAEELQVKQATLSSEDFFSATTDSSALPGSYQVEVVAMAQVQKSVSQGVADKTAHNFGQGTLTLATGDNDPVEIAIDGENNSLTGIMTAINQADTGVTASIINDGTDTPYRLVLTGQDVASDFTLTCDLAAGTDYDAPALTTTQAAQQAHIRVDGIDIYSDTNTLTEAIPGISLDLNQAEPDTLTSLTVQHNEAAIKDQVKSFVSGYNDIMSFISKQAKSEGGDAGILAGDSGLNSIKRRLQGLLTTPVDGSITSLSQLGLETQKDGTLQIDDETLTKVIQTDLPGMTKLLAGDEDTKGIATQFKDYLDGVTDDIDGFYAGRKESIERNIKQIDTSIERFEARMDKREETLYAQFNALEQLVSVMNAQSDYIGKQMTALENLWSYDK